MEDGSITTHMLALVQAIIVDGDLDAKSRKSAQGMEGWTEFALTFRLNANGELSGSSGYAYDAKGANVPFVVHPRKFRPLFAPVLADGLKPGDTQPIAALLTFNRNTARFEMELEYEDATRWKVTPTTLDETVAALRPKLDGE